MMRRAGGPVAAILALEGAKLRRSSVPRTAALAVLVLTVAVTVGGYTAAIGSPDTDAGAKSLALMGAHGWQGLTALAVTGMGVTMPLAVGVVTAWVVGREFTDGTIAGLFGVLPSPQQIAVAKALVVTVWMTVLSAVGAVLCAVGGLTLGLGLEGAYGCAARVSVVGVLLGLATLPIGWVATVGRGYLAGIAATLAAVVVANLASGFGAGALVPWAIPVLWGLPSSSTSSMTLLIPLLVGLLGAVAMVHRWGRLQLGRG